MTKLEMFILGIILGIVAGACLFVAMANGQCGKERVDVKNLVDGVALPLVPERATIRELTAVPEPKGAWLHMPRQEAEKHYYRVTGMLTMAGMEADGDYHLVLSDGRRTMIAEIPNPSCLPSDNSHSPLYAIARHKVDSVLGKILWKGVKSIKPRSIEVCGPLFFDKPNHNGSGHAPNEAEIHPVLFLKFLGD